MPNVSLQYAGGTAAGSTVQQDWLVLEQQDPDSSQQIATLADLGNLFRRAMLQQSARSYVSPACPLSRRRQGNKVFISYTATILVHRSASLIGKYDLIPSEGRLSGGITVQRQMRKSYELEQEAILFLSWLPAFPPQIAWLSKVYNEEQLRVFAPELSSQANGYLYFSEAYKGSLEVSGPAIIDKYSFTFEHQQGYKYDKTILLTAAWGPEDVNGNRQSVQLEVKPPQCWIDEANKCPEENLWADFGFPGPEDEGPFGDLGDDDDPSKWGITISRKHWLLYIGFCSGKILGKKQV